MKNKQHKPKGFSLIELIIAIGIFVIIVGGMTTLVVGSYLNDFENEERLKAHSFLTESWEAVRSIRNNNWADVLNGTHGLRFTNGYWEFNGSSDENDGIVRQIIINDLLRDGDGKIVESGGEIDSDSKSVEVLITWYPTDFNEQTITLNTYLHNYKNPAEWPPVPEEPPPEK